MVERAAARVQARTDDPSDFTTICKAVERALADPDELSRWCPTCRCLTGPAYGSDCPRRGIDMPEGGCQGGWG